MKKRCFYFVLIFFIFIFVFIHVSESKESRVLSHLDKLYMESDSHLNYIVLLEVQNKLLYEISCKLDSIRKDLE